MKFQILKKPFALGISKQKLNYNAEFWESEAFALNSLQRRLIMKGDMIKEKYCKLKQGDIIEMIVDTQMGNISFIVHGIHFGIAFHDDTIKSGDFWPAVSLWNLNSGIEFLGVSLLSPWLLIF